MKRILTLIMTATIMCMALAGCANTATSTPLQSSSNPSVEAPVTSTPEVGVPTPDVKQLSVGTMMVYDFGDLTLHSYETKDPIADENFILETKDELIVIELIGFKNNIEEFQSYIDGLGKPLNSVIVAYHPAGGDAHSNAQMYASEGLGEAALVPGFVEAFGDAFNGNLPTKFELVAPGSMTISGVEFNVIETADAFDLEIPAINVYMTHMVGMGTHNILPSMEAIDGMLAQMKDFQNKNYDLILSGHDIPRTIDIAAEKIDYLEKTKVLANSSNNAEEFIEAMKASFPDYLGENYLEMSAGGLFANVQADNSNIETALALINSFATGDTSVAENSLTESYIQHNLAFGTGRDAFIAAVEGLVAAPSATTVQNVRAFQDGDYVFLHNIYNFAGAGEQVAFDIFRFENEKIAEHWDNLDTRVNATPSGHTQTDGPTEATDLDKTEENKMFIERFVRDILMGENPDKLTDYFDGDNYIQHNVSIADGLSGLGAALEDMAANGIEMIYDEIHIVVGQGDFVLVASEGSFGGVATTYFDLFRVKNGYIAEHWDVMETLMPESEWANNNGKF